MILNNFNSIDYVFLSIFLFLILLSLWRGLIKEIISILAWITGIVIGFSFSPKLAALFANHPALTSAGNQVSERVAEQNSFTIGLCFVLLLVGTLIIGSIINYFMTMIVAASGLSIFNRLLGGIFGFAKAFIIGLAAVFCVQMTAYAQQPIWQESEFVKAYQPVIILLENKFEWNFEDLKTKVNQIRASLA